MLKAQRQPAGGHGEPFVTATDLTGQLATGRRATIGSAHWATPCTGSGDLKYAEDGPRAARARSAGPVDGPPRSTAISRTTRTSRGRACGNVAGRSADILCPVAVSTDEARSLALSLPEAVELDHHGRPSFRVDGRIFATIWNEHRMNVMLAEGGIRTAVEGAPDACEEVWWGKRLAAVGVTLARTDRDFLSDLLADAWEHKAPKRLLGDR